MTDNLIKRAIFPKRQPIQAEKEPDEFAKYKRESKEVDEFAKYKRKSEEPADNEGTLKSGLRTVVQPFLGAASKFTWAADVLNMAATGEAIQDFEELQERLPELKERFPNENWEEKLNPEKFQEALRTASEYAPTQEGFQNIVEDLTGIPLKPKTDFQNDLKLGGQAFGFSPKGLARKTIGGIAAPLASAGLRQTGIPHQYSDPLALGLSTLGTNLKGGEVAKSTGRAQTPPNIPSSIPPKIPQYGTKPKQQTKSTTFTALVPEHELLEKLEPLTKDEIPKALRIPHEEIPTFSGKAPTPPIETQINPHQIQREVGDIIHPSRMPNTTIASEGIRSEINSAYQTEAAKTSKLWNKVEKKSYHVRSIRPNLSSELDDMIAKISEIPNASAVDKDILRTAQIIRQQIGSNDAYMEIPNSLLIKQIQANNKKINHDFVGGRPSNAYIHFNSILGDGIAEAGNTTAYDAARSATREQAKLFGSNEIVPWRDPSNHAHAKLLKSIENPDQLLVIKPILDRSKRGRYLYGAVKRDYIERQFKPYFEDPSKVGDIAFEDKLKELSPLLNTTERTNLEKTLLNHQSTALNNKVRTDQYKQHVLDYKIALQSHKKLVQSLEAKKKLLDKAFADAIKKAPYKTAEQALAEIKTVYGFKRLEKSLSKSEEGKQLLEELKDYASANLLSQGKIAVSDNAEPLLRILNDVNKRALLKYTLGEDVTKDLVEIVNKSAEITQKLRNHPGVIIAKSAAKFVPGLGKYIAGADALADIWSAINPAIRGSDYRMVDTNAIKNLIENRAGFKKLLSMPPPK